MIVPNGAIQNPMMRTLPLYIGQENEAPVSNLNMVEILRFRPALNSFFVLDSEIVPIIKLYDSAGNEIPAGSLIYFARQRPGDQVPTFLPGSILYARHRDLSTTQQRNRDNRPTLRASLGAGITFREEEDLKIFVKSAVVVDKTQPGTTFEFPVRYQTV